jgi:hypothetical protein
MTRARLRRCDGHHRSAVFQLKENPPVRKARPIVRDHRMHQSKPFRPYFLSRPDDNLTGVSTLTEYCGHPIKNLVDRGP